MSTQTDIEKIIAAIEAGGRLTVTPEWLRDRADRYERDIPAAAAFRAIADLMPTPWPTTPGSTARTFRWLGNEGEVRIAATDEDGDWYILGYARAYSVEELVAEGFVPVHDAGAAAKEAR